MEERSLSPTRRPVDELVELADAQALQLAMLRSRNDLLEARVKFDGQAIQLLAHELRSPLAVLVGLLSVLETQDLEDAGRREVVGRCAAQARHLSDVMTDLLSVPLESGFVLPRAPIRPIALRSLVTQAISSVNRLEATDRVRNLVDPELVVATAPSRLLGILINLLDNAAKYGGDGPIDVEARIEDGDVWVTVSDRGPGLPATDAELLFDAFVRGPGLLPDEGHGAGLYLVRKLAQSLGGDAHLANRGGGGAIASVFLPQRRQGDPPPPPVVDLT